MVIKIGKLIFSPIRDIFILVLIDYNTLHLTDALWERGEERADDASDKSPDTELNYERELSSDQILVYGQETINRETDQEEEEGVTRTPPPV